MHSLALYRSISDILLMAIENGITVCSQEVDALLRFVLGFA